MHKVGCKQTTLLPASHARIDVMKPQLKDHDQTHDSKICYTCTLLTQPKSSTTIAAPDLLAPFFGADRWPPGAAATRSPSDEAIMTQARKVNQLTKVQNMRNLNATKTDRVRIAHARRLKADSTSSSPTGNHWPSTWSA